MKTAGNHKHRVLLIAEAANPEWASVPLVGWSNSRAIAALADVHVVTQVRNRAAFLRAGLREDEDFTALDSEAVAQPLWGVDQVLRRVGLGWTASTALAAGPYYFFEHLLWRRFGARIRAGEFSIVHRLTPLSPTIPSLIARRCRAANVPFVVGPLNGGVPWPKAFSDVRRSEGEWLSYVRDAYKLLPGYRSTQTSAAAILVGSLSTRDQILSAARESCVYIPENAIDPGRFGARVDRPLTKPLRVAFVGRLVPYKGADMLLEACAPLARAGLVAVDIIGDGPEMPRLRALAESLGIGAAVKLDGWIENTALQARLIESDVFGFPSIREFGGGVVLEAMALGLAPIVVDYAGPAELVSDTTAFRVPLGTRAEIISRFSAILRDLVAEPETARLVGARARARVLSHFTWERKAQQIVDVYDWVSGARAKPDFGAPFPD